MYEYLSELTERHTTGSLKSKQGNILIDTEEIIDRQTSYVDDFIWYRKT